VTGSIRAKVTITNAGNYAGEEVVQLYIQDVAASLVRPVRELKGFQKIRLAPGETKEIEFVITEKELAFYQEDLRFMAEPGQFRVFIGGSSAAEEGISFWLKAR